MVGRCNNGRADILLEQSNQGMGTGEWEWLDAHSDVSYRTYSLNLRNHTTEKQIHPLPLPYLLVTANNRVDR